MYTSHVNMQNLTAELDDSEREKRRRGTALHRQRMKWETHLQNFRNEKEFVRRYKINPAMFYALVSKLRASCEVESKYHPNMVLTELQLSITLRLLAGASGQDVDVMHGVSSKACMYCMPVFIELWMPCSISPCSQLPDILVMKRIVPMNLLYTMVFNQ
jgi:hypothetical protein